MVAPLVEQLRFTRSEWLRALRGVSDADAIRRIEPINTIGWIVGHLAWQEQRYFLTRAQGITPVPLLDEVAASGGRPTSPPLPAMRAAWREVTGAADGWLGSLPASALADALPGPGPKRTVGDAIQRVTYHYWFHMGEILAIRQLLGHPRRPEFVGDLEGRAPFRLR